MHQEFNFKTLQNHINNRPFSNRYISFKLENEKIKDIDIINLTSYICITENNKYKITMHVLDFLDCAIEKI